MPNFRRLLVKENPKFNVKAWRKRMGLLQSEAADLLETTDRIIRRWEREGVAPRDFYIRIMQRLEVEKTTGIPRKESEARAKVKRQLPKPSAVPQDARFVGIAPSSW